MKRLFAPLFLLVVNMLLLLPQVDFAQQPRTLSYQGILTDSQQEPMPNATYTLTFSLYSTANGGTPLWSETNQVQTQTGVFDVTLGQFTTLTLPFDQQYWLGITLQGKPEMTPRIALVASPYSMSSLQSNVSNGLTPNAKGAVLSLNNLEGNLTIQGNGATSITQAGNTITVTTNPPNTSITAEDNSIIVTNPNGSSTTLRAGIIPLKNIASGNANSDEILRFDGTNWKPGKETQYTSGNGISVQGQIIALASQNATNGQVLKWNGAEWLPAKDDNTSYTAGAGISLSGNQFSALTTGGDLNGLHTNATVTGLVGKKINSTGLANGQVLVYNQSGNTWQPSFVDTNPNDDMLIGTTAGGDLTGSYPNPVVANGAISAIKLSLGAVTTEKIADGQVTLSKLASGLIPTTLPPSGAAGGDLSGTYPNPTVSNIQGKAISSTAPQNGQVLSWNAATNRWEPSVSGTGSVTSVGLSMPSIFSVANSPVTTSGTLATTLTTQTQNQVFASPDGSTGVPSFRAITGNDLPVIALTKGGTGATTASGALTNLLPTQTGNSGKVLQTDGTNTSWVAAANGSVTSVGLSMPSIFSVANSPITGAGTLTTSLATQTQNLIFASPDGSTGTPVFRAIAANDLPTIAINKGGTGATTANGALTNLLPAQTGNSGKVLQTDGTNTSWVAASSGSVTSVGLSMPSIFSVANSPITGAGTLTTSLATQTQNLIFASPDGSTGTPVFRAIAANDLPTIAINKGGTGATTANGALTNLLPAQTGNSGKVLQTDGTNTSWVAASSGSVTSVGLSMPSIFSVANSPITGAGTLTTSLATQTQNLIFASPDGSTGTPVFRAIAANDLPTIAINKGGTGATTANGALTNLLPTQTGNSGKVLQTDGTNTSWVAAANGSVTSVGLSMPSIFSVANSPITGAGTLTTSLATQTQNLIFASPDGSTGTPVFRAIAANDLPTIAVNKGGTGATTASGALTNLLPTQAGNSGKVLQTDGTNTSWVIASSGSVTSVGLSMPSIFSVANSPITGAGTLTTSLATQTQNLIFASPDGSTGTPVFRAIAANDLPTIAINKGGTGATTANGALTNLLPTQTGNSGKVLQTDGTNTSWVAAANGSVTSVGLSMPSIFSVANSPITGTGTLTTTLASQTQNLIFASPDGSTGTPVFRAIAANDLPTIAVNKGGTGATTANGALTNLLPTQTGNTGKVLQTDGTNTSWVAAANGSVTSVGLSMPSIFSVANSPITGTGTLTTSLATQTQNLIFASPDGSTGTPVFRAIAANDLPTIAINKGGTGATTANGALTNLLPAQTGNSGKVLQTDGTNTSWVAASSGSVTSVGLSMPSIFSVANSPITGAGTLTTTLASQTQNLIFASPDGSTGTPVFRAIAANDLPTIAINKGGTGATTANGALTNLLPTQTGNSGKVLQTDGTNTSWVTASSGSVTSVGLSMPSIFSVANSPITGAGTLTTSLATQTQNLIFASPDGSTGTPVFRAIAANDLPTITINKGGTGATTANGALTNLLPTQTGNSGKVLQTDGTNTSWVTAYGGLVNFTESVNTTAPNASKPVVQFLATNAASNVDIALSPKGFGSLTAQIADNTATGGNKRGNQSVDWQMTRATASQVASGSTSFIGGGSNNTASGTSATVVAGNTNNAGGSYSFIGGGNGNSTSGTNDVISGGSNNSTNGSGINNVIGGGVSNSTTGSFTTIGGGGTNSTSGNYATVGGGNTNVASGNNSTVIGGAFNNANASYSAVLGGSNMSINTPAGGSIGFNSDTTGGAAMGISTPKVVVFANNNLWLANNTNAASELRFFEAQSGGGVFPIGTTNYTAFKAGTQSADITYTLPTAQASANTYLKNDGSGNLSWSSSGLVNFTESANSSTPNATIPVVQLLATNAATNVDVALTPKGTGSLLAQIPNDAASGGAKRGTNAIDLQMSRTTAAQVASGNYATIGGGSNNTSSGNNSSVNGGTSNTASGQSSSVGGGSINTANSIGSTISGGNSNLASNSNTTIGGGNGNVASGTTATIGGGDVNTAGGLNSTVSGGNSNNATGTGATISGGGVNTANNTYSSIGGGHSNTASGAYSRVSGGRGNTASGAGSVVGGGGENGGGSGGNTASGAASSILGGYTNSNDGDYSSVLGGRGLTLGANADRTVGYHANSSTGSLPMTIDAPDVAVFGNTNIWLANNKNTASELRFFEAQNSTGAFPAATINYTAFKAGTQSADITYTLPTAQGSSNTFLKNDGSGNLSWAAPNSLGNFVESVNSSAPNASVPVVQLLASNAATNVDIALTPKGSGALTAQIADNTSAGGNKRGTNSVDWQTTRTSASQVASGINSTIGGGYQNTASANYATVAGGNVNYATAQAATVAGGNGNLASGTYAAISGGDANTASSIGSHIGGGYSNNATNQYTTISGGYGNSAISTYATVAGGYFNGVQNSYATVAGGRSNLASGISSFVGGGGDNGVSPGGNTATGIVSATLGGYANWNDGDYSAILGGRGLTLSSFAKRSVGFNSNNSSGSLQMTIDAPDVAVFANANLWLANNKNTPSELRFYEAQNTSGAFPTASTNFTSFKAGTQTADITYVLPTAQGGANTLLKNDGSGNLSWATNGLLNFIESVNNTGPNGGIPVVQLTPNNAGGSVDISLSPKGNGSLMAQIPDNTAAGGNKRGSWSVDFQIIRSAASQVASGIQSFLGNGGNNTLSGSYSGIVGGANNTLTAGYSFIGGGYLNSLTNGPSVIAGGERNTLSAAYGTIGGGYQHTVSGSYTTVSGGNTNTASGNGSTVGGGTNNGATGNFSVTSGGSGNASQATGSAIPGGTRLAILPTAGGTFAFNGDTTGYGMNLQSPQLSVFGNTHLALGSTDGVAREFRFYEGQSGSSYFPAGGINYTGFKAGTMSADVVYTLPTSQGSANTFMKNDGSGNLSWATPNALINFTESVNSAAPNTTTPVVQFLATNAATNVDAAFTPKGTGAVLAQTPNNAISGGNKRGTNAVDWQMIRTAANQVASGGASTIGGGANNKSVGSYSTVSGGYNNDASNAYSTIAGGNSNVVSTIGSFVGGGESNSVFSDYSSILGGRGLTLNSNSHRSVGYNANNAAGTLPMDIDAPDVVVFGNSNLWLANNKNLSSEIRFYEAQNASGAFPAAGTNYTAFKAATQSADITYTLPTGQGGANSILTNDGTGGLSWGKKIVQLLNQAVDCANLPAAGGTAYVDVAVTGAVVGSTVYISPRGDMEDGVVVASVRVSAADNVRIKFVNATNGAVNPAAVNFDITVIQP